MLRQSDIELLALALLAGAGVTGAVAVRQARVGIGTVAAALCLGGLADRTFVDAVPRDALADAGPWLATAAMAGAVAWGASRLPVTPAVVGLPPVLPLALASLVGVWGGVPETSAALLTAGVLGGIALVVMVRRLALSAPASIVIGTLPVGAAYLGAVGISHALVGGVLCSATFVALGLGRRITSVARSAMLRGGGVALASAIVAARLIGVRRDWAAGPIWLAIVLGLAYLAARLLRSDQSTEAP